MVTSKTPVVVVDEEADADLVEAHLSTERERLAHEIGAALAKGVVEPLDVGSLTRLFAHAAVSLGGQHLGVDAVEVGVTDGTLAIIRRQRFPKEIIPIYRHEQATGSDANGSYANRSKSP
jgi:hypothetical protein